MMGVLSLLVMCIAGVMARDSGMLIVNQPKTLASNYTNGSIPERQALFGIPASGHQAKITGTAVYVNAGDIEGCNPIEPEQMNVPKGGVTIFVVERGNCTFVTKVKHAQDAGARAVIIVDNQIEAGLPYMADDGHGSSVTIPSMLIHKDDGDRISAALDNGDRVVLTMGWNIPHPDNVVEWSFWTTSDDTVAREFKKDFDNAAQVLGSSAVMTPHYFIGNGLYSDCYRSDPSQTLPCGTKCTNSGRYCSLTTEEDEEFGVTGAKVITENLRRLCLFRELNRTGHGSNWWNYIENFDANCKSFTKECSDATMSAADVGADPAVIQACIDESGGVDEWGGENNVLEEEMRLRINLGVWQEPTILINEITYRGSMTCAPPIDVTSCGVLATICLGFVDQKKIPACISSPGCPLGQVKDICGKCGGDGALDSCGKCQQKSSPNFNQTQCPQRACDPNSGKFVECGLCGGGPDMDVCGQCLPYGDPKRVDDSSAECPEDSQVAIDNAPPPAKSVGTGAVVAIVAAVLVVIGIAAFFYIRHRNNALKEDIDALLKQYLPMENGPDGGSVAVHGTVQA